MITSRLNRIKQKLQLVKVNNQAFKVFGANMHRYSFHAPATTLQVEQFEKKHNINLPEEYVAFITTIGNGGPGYYGGAGPHYGIYALGEFHFMIGCDGLLASPGIISSRLTEAAWNEHVAQFQNDQLGESIELDRRYDELFQGLLPIGTQGCNFQTMLALHGEDKGRVVYIDQDLQMPIFCPELRFLDWYEAWLDRIATGVAT